MNIDRGGNGGIGWAWVFQARSPVFGSWRIVVLSGRAFDCKCSCATTVYRQPVDRYRRENNYLLCVFYNCVNMFDK